MRYAETGFNLEIDLTRGNVERVETDPKLMEQHLGGLGTSIKLHWDRVPPETKPFDPENLLIFSSGLLCGTPAFSSNRSLVSFVSPQTGLLAYPMMGGFWSSELKYAGYDKVVIRGKSPSLVYIWIHNDKVEIRDAEHLRGKGAVETQELIREELREPDAQVAAIGLAFTPTLINFLGPEVFSSNAGIAPGKTFRVPLFIHMLHRLGGADTGHDRHNAGKRIGITKMNILRHFL